MSKIIPSKFIQEIEQKTGIKMQLSQLAEISGATKQLLNQYKNKELPEHFSEKIKLYFSKYKNTPHEISTDILQEIIEIIEDYLEQSNLTLKPNKKAELIVAIYKFYVDGELKEVKKSNIIQFCKLVS